MPFRTRRAKKRVSPKSLTRRPTVEMLQRRELLAFDLVQISTGAVFPRDVEVDGAEIFFATSDELWKSDGTTSGAVMLADFGTNGYYSSVELDAFNGEVAAFHRDIGSAGNSSLYKVNTSGSGVDLVRDFGAQGFQNSAGTELVEFNGNAFFSQTDSVLGNELWKTDLTSTGTVAITDSLAPGIDSSYPYGIQVFDGQLIFGATDDTVGDELWKTDGTASGVALIKDINPGADNGYPNSSFPFPFAPLGNNLLFNADNGSIGSELWKTDGTETGTVLVKDIDPGPNSSYPYDLTPVGSDVFFTARQQATGEELWKTDGTETGTVLVKDIAPGSFAGPYGAYGYGSYPSNLTALGGQLFFTARPSPVSPGTELWKSDGSATGTTLVVGGVGSTNGPDLTIHDDAVYYIDEDLDKVWRTDGISIELVLSSDEVGDSPISQLQSSGDHLFVLADDLWLLTNIPPVIASTTVTNTLDSGAGSLREAITLANTNPGPDIITFDIPGSGPHVISLATQLPTISDPILVDGSTEPDYDTVTRTPVIQIDGGGSLDRGLRVVGGGDGSAIVGLSVTGFDRAGIELTSVANSAVFDNYLGLDTNGNASPNFQGLRIINATDNLVDGNVISGNDGAGAFVTTTVTGNNTFTNNFVGSDPTGMHARPNGTDGIALRSAGNTVGLPGQGNLVSGNTRWGIFAYTAGRGGNTIQSNTIGLDATGLVPLPNLIGVRVANENNQIGGDAADEFNVISGNSAHGLEIASNLATGNIVYGNRIGTDALGEQDLGNELFGVRLVSSPNNFLGGSGPGQGNVISGNEKSGVIAAFIDADNNEIVGNKIGTSLDGSNAIGNGEDGIRLVQRASGNLIFENQISANGSRGVATDFAFGSNDNEILSNFIGTNADGTSAMHNGTGGGIRILAPGTIVQGNTISAPDAGILAAGNASDLLIQDNFIGVTPSGATTDLGTTFGILFGGANIDRDSLITGNQIANHTRGIRIVSGTGIAIEENSIFSNTVIGIDLGVDNATANDPGDGDTGPNNLQNKATSLVATATTTGPSAINIQFDYDVDSLPANSAFPLTVEFFLSDDSGQGIFFLTSDTYSSPGAKTFNQSFDLSSFPFIPEFGTATVTDANGNTSEFSNAVPIVIIDGGAGEPLALMAPTPAAVYDSMDVNSDRSITAVDVLQVINEINKAIAEAEPNEAQAGVSRLDVNQDGSVTALDALIIINHLNAGEPANPLDEVFADWDDSLEEEGEFLRQFDDEAFLF